MGIVDNLFKNIEKKEYKKHSKRNYDVKITFNKNGKSGDALVFRARFAFLNKAAEKFAGSEYIQMSIVDMDSTRIYFRLWNERRYRDVYKLSESSSKGTALCVAVTFNDGEGKAYRAKWINKEFVLHHDDVLDLDYIELEA